MLCYFPTGKGCNQIHRMCTKGFVSFDFPVLSGICVLPSYSYCSYSNNYSYKQYCIPTNYMWRNCFFGFTLFLYNTIQSLRQRMRSPEGQRDAPLRDGTASTVSVLQKERNCKCREITKSWSFKKKAYLVTEVSELLMQIKSSAQGHATTVK